MMQTLNQLSAELLPCPFCGREAHIIERVTGPNGPGFFCAVSCYCGGYSAKAHQSATSNNDQMARVEAINRWNHRTGQLVAVPDDAIERVKAENEALRLALHDAIRRPMGVVPASADPFYSPAMADQAEVRRIEKEAAHESTKAELQALRERHERLLIATAASVKTSMDEYKRGEMDGRRHGLSQGLELSARVASAAQYSKTPATDTLRGIQKLMGDQSALKPERTHDAGR